jgi:hypothetical protein
MFGGDIAFNKTKVNDSIKTKCRYENNIKLLRIHYLKIKNK